MVDGDTEGVWMQGLKAASAVLASHRVLMLTEDPGRWGGVSSWVDVQKHTSVHLFLRWIDEIRAPLCRICSLVLFLSAASFRVSLFYTCSPVGFDATAFVSFQDDWGSSDLSIRSKSHNSDDTHNLETLPPGKRPNTRLLPCDGLCVRKLQRCVTGTLRLYVWRMDLIWLQQGTFTLAHVSVEVRLLPVIVAFKGWTGTV